MCYCSAFKRTPFCDSAECQTELKKIKNSKDNIDMFNSTSISKEEQIKELENQKLEIDKKIEELKSVETIEEVYKSLFENKRGFVIALDNKVESFDFMNNISKEDFNYCTSKEQCERDLLRIQWRNLSTYLNDNVEYKFIKGSYNWFVYRKGCVFAKEYDINIEDDMIYFNSIEIIEKAIKIFGEDNIKKMLGV